MQLLRYLVMLYFFFFFFKQKTAYEILAVYDIMQKAVERARSGQGPTLVETLTYRIGAHTTADDPTRYRDPAEVQAWQVKDPITRFQKFLIRLNPPTEHRAGQIGQGV